MLQFKETIAIL